MNKYEEALKELLSNADYLINTSDKNFTLTFDTLRGLGVRNSLMAQRLEDLVKRATPMKPVSKPNKLFVVECPNCKKNNMWLDDNFCPNCGQAIDWSDK